MEAQDIFGLDFDFDEFEKYGRDDFSSEEEEEDYEDDTEDGAPRRPKKKSTKKSIYEVSDSIAWLGCVWKTGVHDLDPRVTFDCAVLLR